MITDWLMVVITAVYVLATIAICRANYKSANASREQLKEMKWQYEDKKRIEIMPYIQFEITRENTEYVLNLVLDSDSQLTGVYSLKMRMKNIGNGTAKDISYEYKYENNCYDRNSSIKGLLSGEEHIVKMSFGYSENNKNDRSVCFIFHFKDLLENAYSQQITINFLWNSGGSLSLKDVSASPPILEVKELSHG